MKDWIFKKDGGRMARESSFQFWSKRLPNRIDKKMRARIVFLNAFTAQHRSARRQELLALSGGGYRLHGLP